LDGIKEYLEVLEPGKEEIWHKMLFGMRSINQYNIVGREIGRLDNSKVLSVMPSNMTLVKVYEKSRL